jgi:hypothetical protein
MNRCLRVYRLPKDAWEPYAIRHLILNVCEARTALRQHQTVVFAVPRQIAQTPNDVSPHLALRVHQGVRAEGVELGLLQEKIQRACVWLALHACELVPAGGSF